MNHSYSCCFFAFEGNCCNLPGDQPFCHSCHVVQIRRKKSSRYKRARPFVATWVALGNGLKWYGTPSRVVRFLFFGGGLALGRNQQIHAYGLIPRTMLSLGLSRDASVKRGHYTLNNDEPCIFGNIPEDPHETN